MSTATQEATADLAQLLLQWDEPLPPCTFTEWAAADRRVLWKCGKPSVGLVTVRCSCGTFRRPQCSPHLSLCSSPSDDTEVRCRNCDQPQLIIGVSR